VRFNSYEFVVFFAVLLALLPFFRGCKRHGLLLAASYVFYGAWNVPFVSLLVFTTALDFFCGSRLARAATLATKRAWLAFSLLGNLGNCDFSAYSTMGQGLASMLGFTLPRNFDYPQLRHNPLLYRRTWHITLGNWITDYVYRPLGGSRVGDVRFAFNLMLTWTLLGLWHGAAWNFVLWGLYNGVILAVYSVVMRRKRWSLPAFPGKLFCGWLLIVASNLVSSVFFRAQNAADAGALLGRMLSWAPGDPVASEWWGVLALLLGVHALSFWYYKEDLLERLGWPGRIALITATVLAIACFGAGGRPFIYFQF
jgi:alginate O-acetyltransferase complex protein AlgI